MNFDRISPTIDVDRMQQSHATIIGGGYGLAHDLVRCGARDLSLVDFDRIGASNPARQDLPNEPGAYKIEATAASLRRINPDVDVECHFLNYCAVSQEEFDTLFGHTDLLVHATDFFPAQARGNVEALRLNKPSLWIGMYRHGRAGEIIYYVPGITPACYRCICGTRYDAFRAGGANITSDGGTILDLHLVDAIAGHVGVGILTRGADNRMGRLIEQLGDRNLLQVKIDPQFKLGGTRDIFAHYLGDHPANFSFTTVALPMEREPDCPDCGRYNEPPEDLSDD